MNTFLSTKSKSYTPPSRIPGAVGWFEEMGFEIETPPATTVVKGVGGVIEDVFSLVGDIVGTENKTTAEPQKFSQGSIENFNKKEKADKKKIFFQSLKEDQQRAQQAKEKLLFEEEIDDFVTNLPTEQKNELLHYQASYRDRSIYQRAQLRIELIKQRKQADKQNKEASMAETKPKAYAMQTAFEGGSGSQGSGTANLSAHATG